MHFFCFDRSFVFGCGANFSTWENDKGYIAEGYLRTFEGVGVVFKHESSEFLRYPFATSRFPVSQSTELFTGPEKVSKNEEHEKGTQVKQTRKEKGDFRGSGHSREEL